MQPNQAAKDCALAIQRIGIAADHGGFELKEFLAGKLREAGYAVTDFGDRQLKSNDELENTPTVKTS